MTIFGKSWFWWRDKYFSFENICSEGNTLIQLPWSKITRTFWLILFVGGVSVGAQEGLGMEMFAKLPSWLAWTEGFAYFLIERAIFILPAYPIVELLKDFGLGLLSRKIGTMQARAEWGVRKGINRWEWEKMKRLRMSHLLIYFLFRKLFGIEMTEEDKKLFEKTKASDIYEERMKGYIKEFSEEAELKQELNKKK